MSLYIENHKESTITKKLLGLINGLYIENHKESTITKKLLGLINELCKVVDTE